MQRVRRETLAWILAALLGLAVAAGVMAAASHLSSQRVGLASEPPSAGARLAPAGEPAPSPPTRRPRRPAGNAPPKKVTTTTTPSTPAPPPNEATGDGDGDADD